MRRALVLVVLLVAGCSVPEQRVLTPPATTPVTDPPLAENATLRLEPFLTGLTRPVLLTDARDGSGRHFVVEQGGLIRIGRNGTLFPEPFLDLTRMVSSGSEQGLLGLAFSPNYTDDGRFYVDYTDTAGDTILARYHVSNDPDRADEASAETLLKVDQPFANHNGGGLAFGPDGYLYVGLGDGGGAGDPSGNGQDPHALLASLLRLDVSPSTGYAVPPDNPHATEGGAREVWAKGLRNPWRFSFDRTTGDLWIGDVGQSAREEIDYQPRASRGGENYGWSVWEGTHRFALTRTPFKEVTAPVAEYGHDEGCSVTGGHVLRSPSTPSFNGTFVYADYCSGTVWGVAPANGTWAARKLLETGLRVSSFGEDERGEVYLVSHAGAVFRLVEG